MKKFNYKLKIEIFRNSTQNFLGVLRGSFQGFGCPKRHPDALLAKTMMRLMILLVKMMIMMMMMMTTLVKVMLLIFTL